MHHSHNECRRQYIKARTKEEAISQVEYFIRNSVTGNLTGVNGLTVVDLCGSVHLSNSRKCSIEHCSRNRRVHERIRNIWAFQPSYFLSRPNRSEEHTSELQSLRHLVCRLLL